MLRLPFRLPLEGLSECGPMCLLAPCISPSPEDKSVHFGVDVTLYLSSVDVKCSEISWSDVFLRWFVVLPTSKHPGRLMRICVSVLLLCMVQISFIEV